MKTKIHILLSATLSAAYLLSCSDVQEKKSENHLPSESAYTGAKVADDARSETEVKQTPEDREFWGNVNNLEIVNAVFDAVYSGKAKAYDFITGTPFTIEEVKRMESSVDTVYAENFETGQKEMKVIENKLSREDIVKFFFKENWYFDRNNFKLTKEVKAITLLMEKFSEKGELLGHSPLFTVYFDNKYEPTGTELSSQQ